MSKPDIHAILGVLWLIASGVQGQDRWFAVACAAMFAFYAVSSAVLRIREALKP